MAYEEAALRIKLSSPGRKPVQTCMQKKKKKKTGGCTARISEEEEEEEGVRLFKMEWGEEKESPTSVLRYDFPEEVAKGVGMERGGGGEEEEKRGGEEWRWCPSGLEKVVGEEEEDYRFDFGSSPVLVETMGVADNVFIGGGGDGCGFHALEEVDIRFLHWDFDSYFS